MAAVGCLGTVAAVSGTEEADRTAIATREGRRPNVVFILTDNQSAWTLGCYGNRDIHTPNIDKLAGQGIRFDRCFTSNAVCSPTRATYLTGLIPSQHGVHSYIANETMMGPKASYTLAEFCTLPKIMHDAGYVCGLAGKWHLGDNIHPQDGFSFWVTMTGGHTNTFYDHEVIEDGKVHKEPTYLTEWWTKHAVRFIEENCDRPFFLYLPYNGPYGLGGWMLKPGRGPHVADYADAELLCFPRAPMHPWLRAYRESINNVEAMRRYAEQVTGVDDGVGEVTATLRRLGLDDNTIVIYAADQGLSGGHNGLWGMGDHSRPMQAFDSSVRIPLIWRLPGGAHAGTVCDGMVSNYDFMPTLLSVLGLSDRVATEPASPGRDYSAALREEPLADWDDVIFYDYENTRMVRTGEWKLTLRFPDGPDELYHVAKDPGEFANEICNPAHADVRDELQKRLEGFFTRYADPKYDLWKGGVSKAPLVSMKKQ